MTGGDFLSLAKMYLRHLKSHFDLFSNIYLISNSRVSELDFESDPNFMSWWVESISDYAYINSDSNDKTFHLTSKCLSSFSAHFSNRKEGEGDAVTIEIRAGGTRSVSPDLVIIRCYDDSVSSKDIFDIFRMSIEFWHPSDGSASREIFYKETQRSIGELSVGWLTYIKNPDALANVPAQFRTDRVDGGVLVKISEEIPAAGDKVIIFSIETLKMVLQQAGIEKR